MIQLSKNYTLPERAEDTLAIKIIGVGGAGANALDRVVLDGLDRADLLAANTDAQALASSVVAHKVQLGRNVTRGLGAGGDPDLGYEAAVEAADELRQGLQDARVVFLCAGLGGGTGSGAAPVIAELVRETGALVVGFVTLPFSFEGKRRGAQALAALARLQQVCDAVVCFENDKMGDMVAPKAGVHQAFAAADVMISQSMRAIVGLLQRPGLIRIGFDDLLAALRNTDGRCLFGFGESDSDNRAHDALTQALKSPLMDRGRLLEDARNLLVQVSGGPGMTLSEVEILMQELNRHVGDETQILFGTAVDGRLGDRLAVTLISSLPANATAVPSPEEHAQSVAAAPPAPPVWEPAPVAVMPEPVAMPEPEPETGVESEIEEIVPPKAIEAPMAQDDFLGESDESVSSVEPSAVAPEPEAAPEPIPPTPPRVILPHNKTAAPPPREPKVRVEKTPQAKQEVLQFESVTRGRFEKSEPTIVDGQDLDVPTFLRKNVRVK